MSRKQWVVFQIGGVLFLALTLFPPWRIESRAYDHLGGVVPCELRAGYSFLFLPPRQPSRAFQEWPTFGEAQIDLPLLLAEWAIVVTVAGLASFALRNTHRFASQAPALDRR
jgi:hypothetical protein